MNPTLALRALLDACTRDDRAAVQNALVDLTASLVASPLPHVRIHWVAAPDGAGRVAVYQVLSEVDVTLRPRK